MLSRLKARRNLRNGPAVEGLDGWFFLSDQFEDEISVAAGLTPPEPGQLDDAAQAVTRFGAHCAARGARFLFAPAPAKPVIYADKLPQGIAPAVSRRFGAALLGRLDPTLWLDLSEPLIAARAHFETFSRLNSHWSDYGALVAWQALEARLVVAGLPAAAQGLPLSQVEYLDGFNEMAGLIGFEAPNNWAYPHFETYIADVIFDLPDGTESPQLGRRAVQLGDMPIQVRNPSAQTGLSCLVVSDSSAVSLSPYFNRHFARVRYARHSYIGTPGEAQAALEAEAFDVVLLMNAERYCPRLSLGI